MKRPKLLVSTSTLPRFAGDPEPRFVLDLSKSLTKYFDVTILAPMDSLAKSQENLEGVTVIRYHYAPFQSWETLCYPGAILPRLQSNPLMWTLVPLLLLGQIRMIRKLLREQSFDGVHCHWLYPQGLIQALFFSGSNAPPFIVTSHGTDTYGFSGSLGKKMKKFVINKAAALTFVSAQMRDYALQQGFLQPHKQSHVSVIPMGVDANHFSPENRSSNWRNQNNFSGKIVLFVGRLSPNKGVNHLLEALTDAALRDRHVMLCIVGDGPARSKLEQKVRDLGITSKVRFLGSLGHQELPTVYASCDIFCLPSIIAKGGYREGLPTVLCEAFACGLPAVASDIGGVSEIVKNGENGYLIPHGDSKILASRIADIIDQKDGGESYSHQARQTALNFDWNTVLSEQFYGILKDVISNAKQS